MEKIKKYILEQVAAHGLSIDAAKNLLEEIKKPDFTMAEDIAVVGLECRLPKASSADEFWKNLINGRNCIGKPEKDRSEIILSTLRKITGIEIMDEMLEAGGYMDQIHCFDAPFFGIRKKEAQCMDPWQRVLLEVVYLAIEDAGISLEKIRGTETGVYIGRDNSCESSYGRLTSEQNPYILNGSYAAVLASRISHVFDLTGPCFVTDTACSSAIVALHQAVTDLKIGQVDVAVVGGINIKENLANLSGNPMARILAGDEKIRTFDAQAKGTLLGEGVGVFILKRLKDACADNDYIYAVIKGTAINNDGATKMISAPNAATQEKVIQKAWENAGIDPETIEYIEAHGTGTLLGDSIEITAIQNAFRNYTKRKQFCALGAVKPGIGHTVAASAMASMTKAVLSLKNGCIPGNINFSQVSPLIDFMDSPLYVNDCFREWKKGESPRRCGVNSFGFSGTNGHVVFEEAPSEEPTGNYPGPWIFTVSAKTSDRLFELLKCYKGYFEEGNTADLLRICYTAACGRNHFDVRLAILTDSKTDLYQKICRLIDRGLHSEVENDGIYYGIVREEQPDGGKTERKNQQELCRRYVNGEKIRWEEVYQEIKVTKTKLPLYPLERIPFWHDIKKIGSRSDTNVPSSKEPESKQDANHNLGCLKGREDHEYSSIEKYTAGLWGEVLKLPEIDVADNFYLIGGDSMRALQIVNRIYQEKGIKIEVSDLLEHPIMEDFAAYLSRLKMPEKSENEQYLPLLRLPESEYYEVSAAQIRMYLSQQMDKVSTVYNMPKGILITGKFDKERCNEIFHLLLEKHETLRTSFHMQEGRLVQKIHKNIDFSVCMTEDEKGEATQKLQDFVRPFDLSRAPLLRVELCDMGENRTLLLFDIHHIVCDGTSMDYFIREFMELYLGGRPLPLKAQYKEYAAWQNRMLESGALDRQKEYWLKRFEGDIPVLEFPVTAAAKEIDRGGKKYFFRSSGEMAKRLDTFCHEEEVTLFMALLSAYYVLLYQYTGQNDITVGIPIAGRRHPDVYGIIGMFINTIPVRHTLDVNAAFTEHLAAVKQLALEAYQNQDYPFDKLVSGIGARGRTEETPLFNVMFNLQDKNMEQKQLDHLQFEHIEVDFHISKFDLTLNAVKEPDCISFEFEYNANIFSDKAVRELAGYYLHVINQVINKKNMEIKEIQLLSLQELSQVVKWGTGPEVEYPNNCNLYELFKENTWEKGVINGIIEEERAYTFSELDIQALAIAGKLSQLGVMPGDTVAIYCFCNFYMISAMLAIWKIGAVYLPIDPVSPMERVNMIISDGQPTVLIAEIDLYSQILNQGTVILNPRDCKWDGEKTPVCEQINASDTAYILYTSGSSGVPKAVKGTYRGMLNRLHWGWLNYPYEENEVCCQKTSLGFVDSLFEITGPLLQGIPLVIVNQMTLRDPFAFIRLLNEQNISRLTVVPSFLRMLLEAMKGTRKEAVSLKNIVCSGEALSADLVSVFFRVLPEARLLNYYGSTEVSADVTCYEVCRKDARSPSVPIGHPIANTGIHILSRDENHVPPGVLGEICVSGDSLCGGYANNGALNNERFTNLKWQDAQGVHEVRIYKTGDIGRINEKGQILYCGRRDNQIKVAGHRIEKGEIEFALLGLSGISQAVIETNLMDYGAGQIIAYVVPEKGWSFCEFQIKEALASKLPSYMIPSIIVECDSFPMLPNGKIDKKQLPIPELYVGNQTDFVSPQTDMEKDITAIWSEVIRRERISITDDFFDIGGNSLMAMQVILRIEEITGIALSLKEVLDHRTIKKLALHIEDKLIEGVSEEELEMLMKNL